MTWILRIVLITSSVQYMRSKTAVILAIPLLFGIVSCSGKASESECREMKQSIETSDAEIKVLEARIKGYGDTNYGSFTADLIKPMLETYKDQRILAMEEFREKGC